MHNEIKEIVGEVFVSVRNKGDESLVLEKEDGRKFAFYHEQALREQDCCGSVYIEDVCGDLSDLEKCVIISATEETSQKDDEHGGSGTWTFYKFWSEKGYVTVRWYGSSNGYYSESVDYGWL